MATRTARRAPKSTPLPQPRADRQGPDKMATIYRTDAARSPWANFQNAGPDVYWEVPTTAPAPVN